MQAKGRPTGLEPDLGAQPNRRGAAAASTVSACERNGRWRTVSSSGSNSLERRPRGGMRRDPEVPYASPKTKRTTAPLRTPPERRKPNSFEFAGSDHIISGLSSTKLALLLFKKPGTARRSGSRVPNDPATARI